MFCSLHELPMPHRDDPCWTWASCSSWRGWGRGKEGIQEEDGTRKDEIQGVKPYFESCKIKFQFGKRVFLMFLLSGWSFIHWEDRFESFRLLFWLCQGLSLEAHICFTEPAALWDRRRRKATVNDILPQTTKLLSGSLSKTTYQFKLFSILFWVCSPTS